MSQHAERARAVNQARKLMEMTTSAGASENEAQMAMDKLSKLKQTFNLTLDEIVVSAMEYVSAEVKQTAVKGCPLSTIIVAIGRFTDTKVWSMPGEIKYSLYHDRYGRAKHRRVTDSAGTYNFFGIDSDVEMAKFLYEMIVRSMVISERIFMRSNEYNSISVRGGKRAALVSFRKGFARRIYFRLTELADENQTESTAVATTGNDIVFIKEKVREAKFQDQIGIKLVKKTSQKRGITDWNAGNAGANTANSVNFSRPINSDNGSNVKLLT